MHFRNLILFVCSLLFICACASKNGTIKSPAPTNSSLPASITRMISSKHDRIDELLLFIESYSNLTLDAQKKVFASTNQTLAENKNNLVQRIKLAIILALPTSRLHDTTKAQGMLQDLLREDSLEPEETALLGLLYEYAQNDNKQLQKNRDDAKKLESVQQKYEALLQKYDALEQKLNELKNIEKTMNERSTKADTKP